jgi:hypothetical protein
MTPDNNANIIYIYIYIYICIWCNVNFKIIYSELLRKHLLFTLDISKIKVNLSAFVACCKQRECINNEYK